MVGAVQPHVDERRGRAQHARQVRAAHHARRGAVALEQREDVVGLPRRVAQLDGHAHPVGQRAEEPVQPGVVALLVGPQLDEHDLAPLAQLVPGAGDALRPGLGRVQALGVGQAARRLHRHAEPGRQAAPPAGERRLARPPVEAGVELDGVELLRRSGRAGPTAAGPGGRARRPSGRRTSRTSRSGCSRTLGGRAGQVGGEAPEARRAAGRRPRSPTPRPSSAPGTCPRCRHAQPARQRARGRARRCARSRGTTCPCAG